MTVEQQLYNALLAYGPANAIIQGRLYESTIPPNPTYPLARFQRVSTKPLYTHNAGNQATVGWARFQIDVWDVSTNSAAVVEAFGQAVEGAMQTFNAWDQSMSPATVSAPNYVLTRRRTTEPNTSPPLGKMSIDVQIWY